MENPTKTFQAKDGAPSKKGEDVIEIEGVPQGCRVVEAPEPD